jgi:hypothetical protein
LESISASLDGRVAFFDSLDIFCDKISCYGVKDKSIYYVDDNHLSKTGSKFVFKYLLDFIEKGS